MNAPATQEQAEQAKQAVVGLLAGAAVTPTAIGFGRNDVDGVYVAVRFHNLGEQVMAELPSHLDGVKIVQRLSGTISHHHR